MDVIPTMVRGQYTLSYLEEVVVVSKRTSLHIVQVVTVLRLTPVTKHILALKNVLSVLKPWTGWSIQYSMECYFLRQKQWTQYMASKRRLTSVNNVPSLLFKMCTDDLSLISHKYSLCWMKCCKLFSRIC